MATETPDAAPIPAIRTFHPRRGRMGTTRAEALDRHWSAYGLTVPDDCTPFDPRRLFGRDAPLVLEIGCGMGDAAVAMAAADPGRDYLAVDVHTPGLGNVVAQAHERGLTNLRAVRGDAMELLRDHTGDGAFDAIHVFFPDPWPKQRHHKRRMIQPDAVALMVGRLAPDGTLRCATDWPEYAGQMLAVLTAEPGLANHHEAFAPRPPDRPVTKFEARAIAAGRTAYDLEFRRVVDHRAKVPA